MGDLNSLYTKVNRSFSFDTSVYKQIKAAFYLVIANCENKKIKNISLRDQDSGLIRTVLLNNLKKQLEGFEFSSVCYVPEVVLIPIVLMNPLAEDYGGFNFNSISRRFSIEDISLVKGFWSLKLVYYMGSIDRWKRHGASETEPWF